MHASTDLTEAPSRISPATWAREEGQSTGPRSTGGRLFLQPKKGQAKQASSPCILISTIALMRRSSAILWMGTGHICGKLLLLSSTVSLQLLISLQSALLALISGTKLWCFPIRKHPTSRHVLYRLAFRFFPWCLPSSDLSTGVYRDAIPRHR